MNTSRRNFVLATGALGLSASLASMPAFASDAGDAAALVGAVRKAAKAM